MTAVRQNGMALQYASKELKNHVDIVGNAVVTDVRAYQFASEELKKNKVILVDSIPSFNPY